jgi:pyruvate,orthophosphate dikinase
MRLPVPPGFIVTTETCLEYFTNHKQMSTQLVDEYTHAVNEIEKQTGRKFPSKHLSDY